MMHNGNWDSGPGNGSWLWMALMMVTMIALLGGFVAVLVLVLRRPHLPAAPHPTLDSHAAVAAQSPQEILAGRLARGEIELDDYHQRREALDHPTP